MDTNPAGAGGGFSSWVRNNPARFRLILALTVFSCSFAFFASNLASREVDGLEAQDIYHFNNIFLKGLPADQSPVYYAFGWFWEKLNNTSVAFLRAPSAFFAAVAAAFVFLATAEEASVLAALLAALILTLNPLVAYHARITRAYGMELMLAAICLLYAVRYLKAGKTTDLIGLAAIGIVGIYTHLFFSLYVASLCALVILYIAKHREKIPAALAVGVLGALSMIPQVFHVKGALGQAQGIRATMWSIPHEFTLFFKTFGRQFIVGLSKPGDYANMITIAMTLLLLAGALIHRRRGILAVLVILVPSLVAGWRLSYEHVIVTRYLIYLWPVVAGLMGIGLARL